VKLYTLLFLFILTLLAACSGQNTAKSLKSSSTYTLGDKVEELSKSIWIVYQAANGDFWFGSDTDGTYKVDGKEIIHYSTSDGLSSDRIRAIQGDRHGNIYITTIDDIHKYDGSTFTTLTPIYSSSPTEHWKLQDDDLWFSTLGKNGEKGPSRYDGKNLYQLEFPKNDMEDEYYAQFPNASWSPYDVYTIYKDSKGTMWFGTSNLGVCRYDGISHSWLYEDHLTNTPRGGSFGIRSILEDRKGKYWFCNTRYRYDISPDSIVENERVLVKYEKEIGIEDIKYPDGMDHVYFMSAINDNNGAIWMATYAQGVWKYDGMQTTHYPVQYQGKDITLFSIYKDNNGDLWLGTHGAGLYKFNGQSFEKFSP
jgi:ligand-binding sensor domain-containing protein